GHADELARYASTNRADCDVGVSIALRGRRKAADLAALQLRRRRPEPDPGAIVVAEPNPLCVEADATRVEVSCVAGGAGVDHRLLAGLDNEDAVMRAGIAGAKPKNHAPCVVPA